MNYSFQYQNKVQIHSDKGLIKINPHGLLIKLFRIIHRTFPNSTPRIRDFLDWINRHNRKESFGADLSSEYNMNIYHITYSDYIEIDDTQTLRQSLLAIAKRNPLGFFDQDAIRQINSFFDSSEHSYNTASFGHLFSISTTKIKKLDLIDYISFNYLKGRNSHIFITYTITPSQICRDLFSEALMSEQEEYGIYLELNNLKNIFKRRSIIKSFGVKPNNKDYLCTILLNEISWQFKNFLQKTVRNGELNQNKDKVLPHIITYSYRPNGHDFQGKIAKFMSLSPREIYTENDCISIFMKPMDKTTIHNICLIIPEEQKDKEYRTKLKTTFLYKDFIVLFNLLINVAGSHKSHIITLQKNIYKFINKNKTSLFLTEDSKLKAQLTIGNIKLSRLLQDITCPWWISELKSEMPRLKNKTSDNKEIMFAEHLIEATTRYCNYLLQTYKELNQICKEINENNLLQANMKLQRIILWLTFIGTILAIYGANSQYCNEKFLLIWDYLISIKP